MLASLYTWWLARISELLPMGGVGNASRLRDGLVVNASHPGDVSFSLRKGGKTTVVTAGAASRQAGRMAVLIRPPPEAVLVKQHTVPNGPRRQLGQALRYELARITPFSAEALFWRWDGRPKPDNRARMDVVLTMVPRAAVAPALEALTEAGLKPDFIETGPVDRPLLLPAGDPAQRPRGARTVRVLAVTCAALAAVALLLPFGLQALTLQRTNAAIAALQPQIDRIEALRRGIASGDAGRDVLAHEMQRTGDVLQILATVTRILPDDTYLNDFALRERQMTLSGRSAAAARLITALSADAAIRNAAFAAPVTRIEGVTADVFSIRAEAAQ